MTESETARDIATVNAQTMASDEVQTNDDVIYTRSHRPEISLGQVLPVVSSCILRITRH